jgi:phosphate starvation-inducible PhoH-like protein
MQFAKSLARTPNQKSFSAHIGNPNVTMVVGVGPAGSGKTLLACTHGIERLLNKDIKKIVVTRPTVCLSENLGYLPGTMEDKMSPWMVPVFEYMKEYISSYRLKEFLSNEEIEICPLAYIRGRTFVNTWVIADEAQNATVGQVKTLLTRVGHESKIILTGDLDQCDLKEPSGLADFVTRLETFQNDIDETHGISDIQLVRFDMDDVMRSEFVKRVLNIYGHGQNQYKDVVG